MRFAYHHSMCPAEQYTPLAIKAEELGFDGISMPESICYPKEAESKYPYNEDGSREFLDNEPFIDPFILVAHMAASTQKLRFTTQVMKLALRQPVMVAKMITSLGIITNNRFSCGCGISPWQEDFEAAQVPWAGRGKRMNEIIDIVKGLMDGEYFGYQGDVFQIPELKLCPAPSVPVPILLGGHSEPALKRAARVGDGWIGAGGSLEDMARMVARVNELRKEYGRDHLPFEFHATSEYGYTVDGVEQLREIGMTDITIAFRNVYASDPDTKTLEQKYEEMGMYVDYVMSKCKSS